MNELVERLRVLRECVKLEDLFHNAPVPAKVDMGFGVVELGYSKL